MAMSSTSESPSSSKGGELAQCSSGSNATHASTECASTAPTSSGDSSSGTTTGSTVEKGVAGRINYAAWDKVATDLVQQVETEDMEETAEETRKLGLNGKYARSADEAAERVKAKTVQTTKKTLDSFKARETSIIQSMTNLAWSSNNINNNKTTEKQVVRITRDHLDAGKRVLSVTDVTGIAVDQSIIVLTADLSLLESKMPVNSNTPVKTYADDAENDVIVADESTSTTTTTTVNPPQTHRSIYGVIKVFLANLENCTVIVKCKIITGTVELHNCRNVCIKVEKEATVATVQADVSENITIQFHDAVSGKHVPGQKQALFWGDDKDDRIFHAGVSNLLVQIYRDGYLESHITSDYIADGAEQMGNATPKEYQFVTSCHNQVLLTEAVVRTGGATGSNVRAMTDREMKVEQERRAHAARCAVKMADDMIQIKDKDGNILVRKQDVVDATTANETVDEEIEEVYTSITKADIQLIVEECEKLKGRGNEAFGAGEYGQAILHYSLCLDKAQELPDVDEKHKVHTTTATGSNSQANDVSLFPRDVIYSNRAAAFLKLGQHEKAEADAVKALAINPHNIKATFRHGLALHASAKYAEALPVLAAAHKLEPHNQQIKQALQFCEVRREQEHRKRMAGM